MRVQMSNGVESKKEDPVYGQCAYSPGIGVEDSSTVVGGHRISECRRVIRELTQVSDLFVGLKGFLNLFDCLCHVVGMGRL